MKTTETRTEVHKAHVGNKKGWSWSAYFDGRDYPGIQAALFNTKHEAEADLKRYLTTGKFATWGSAED